MLLLFEMYNIFAYICVFLSIFAYVRASPQSSKNDTPRNLLPNRAIESFWDALWLGIQAFLCFTFWEWYKYGGGGEKTGEGAFPPDWR